MATITPRTPDNTEQLVIKSKKKDRVKGANRGYKWWSAKSQIELTDQTLATALYLKEVQQYRERQASIHARLYGNLPLSNFGGSSFSQLNQNNKLPVDRPTMNVVYSCVDTLTSRLTQSKPRPVFLTDGGDSQERSLGKQMNQFIMGEFYRTKAYELGEQVLRHGEVLGTGCAKIIETDDHKTGVEWVLLTELLVDANEAKYGKPRNMYQFKMVDREVAAALFEKASVVERADQATFDAGRESTETTSDQIILVEAWHLPSKKGADDGRHVIVCSSGVLLDEPYTKDRFPFAFLHYSPRLLGFWGQGVPEQLLGTQIEINKLLMTISESINLVGVPRVFVEEGSKVVKAQLNDQVGAIVTYRGIKPEYEVAPCVPQELYAQLQRLVEYAFQQCGISQMSAASVKPAGLDSGNAIREHEAIQDARFSALQTRYDNFYIDLAYLMIDKAVEIAKRDGSYSTVYPNKDGTKEVDLPKIDTEGKNDFVIQCFDSSSLPRDPAGRKQSIIEDMQAGILSPQEGRRLLDYPDLGQVEKLANAGEERILKILDDIVEHGKYTPPDNFIDLQLATQLTTQYYNLYVPSKLPEGRRNLLNKFFLQLQALQQAMQPPAPPMGAPGADPLGQPAQPQISDMLPVKPGAQ